jgi:hypothetical protein
MITTISGFYRYRLFDILLITGMKAKTPMVEFMERKGCILNLCGEKMQDAHLQDAMSLTLKELNINITDFSVRQINTQVPGYYIFYMEAKLPNDVKPEQVAESIHKNLKVVNCRFVYHSTYGLIAPSQMKMLYHGTYELYKALRVAQGSSANQCKPLRLPTSQMHIDFLEEMSKGGEFDACDLA